MIKIHSSRVMGIQVLGNIRKIPFEFSSKFCKKEGVLPVPILTNMNFYVLKYEEINSELSFLINISVGFMVEKESNVSDEDVIIRLQKEFEKIFSKIRLALLEIGNHEL